MLGDAIGFRWPTHLRSPSRHFGLLLAACVSLAGCHQPIPSNDNVRREGQQDCTAELGTPVCEPQTRAFLEEHRYRSRRWLRSEGVREPPLQDILRCLASPESALRRKAAEYLTRLPVRLPAGAMRTLLMSSDPRDRVLAYWNRMRFDLDRSTEWTWASYEGDPAPEVRYHLLFLFMERLRFMSDRRMLDALLQELSGSASSDEDRARPVCRWLAELVPEGPGPAGDADSVPSCVEAWRLWLSRELPRLAWHAESRRWVRQ